MSTVRRSEPFCLDGCVRRLIRKGGVENAEQLIAVLQTWYDDVGVRRGTRNPGRVQVEAAFDVPR